MSGLGGLRPLGIFAVVDWDVDIDLARRLMLDRVGVVPVEMRGPLAGYLRGGAMIAPFMEHTFDLLEGRFGVPGGSAMMTDGCYFWRLDTADYVECYGVGLPLAFLRDVEALGFTVPVLTDEVVGDAELWLIDFLDRTSDVDLLREGHSLD